MTHDSDPHFISMIFPPHKLRVGDVIEYTDTDENDDFIAHHFGIISSIQHEDGLTIFNLDNEDTPTRILRHHVDYVTLHGNVTREAADKLNSRNR